jgi:predicted nucleotide-binding protein
MNKKVPQKVFTVHGHDEVAKYTVARFIERLDLEAIILDEQSGGLQAIIDKFEEQAANIVFAIILLTPDDVGAAESEKDKLQPRARQNVILELGYFIGKLERNQICLLYKEGVELPSDIRGQSYVLMDDHDGWQLKLAREMKYARLPIDANKLL